MPNYKKMYLRLFRATEDAANILIAAQRDCEEMYISAPVPKRKVYASPIKNPNRNEKISG